MIANEMETLELEDVASLLGVSERMIRNYMKDNDLPCIGDGRGRRFVWAEVREWYVRYRIEKDGNRGNEPCQIPGDDDENMDEVQLRKLKAEADLKELELATKRGEVVAIEDVKRSMENVAASLKSAILAMPSKLATRLVGMRDKRAINDVLTGEAEELCRKLQHVADKPVEDDEEPDGE